MVAIARGGACEGTPLVSSWVAPDQSARGPDTDWESLERLADVDPKEAEALTAYKLELIRERGET